jgi:hypothetical protein
MVWPGRRSRCTPILAAAIFATGCDDGELRGRTDDSKDGKTYLIVADDNGGHCGPIRVDGKVWPHALNVPGAVAPGDHRIECGGEIEFRIDSGKTFRVDYWGP